MLLIERTDHSPKQSDRLARFVHRRGVDRIPSQVVDIDRLFRSSNQHSELGRAEQSEPARIDDLVKTLDKGGRLSAQLNVEPVVSDEGDVSETVLARHGDVATTWDQIPSDRLSELCELSVT